MPSNSALVVGQDLPWKFWKHFWLKAHADLQDQFLLILLRFLIRKPKKKYLNWSTAWFHFWCFTLQNSVWLLNNKKISTVGGFHTFLNAWSKLPACACLRVSVGWWLLPLTVYILDNLQLTINLFPLCSPEKKFMFNFFFYN